MSYTLFDLCEWARRECLEAIEDHPDSDPITTSYTTLGQVSWDDVGESCGTLVVSPERTYRSVEFPVEATSRELCDPGTICAILNVTLVRCVPTLTDAGRPPAEADVQARSEAIMRDAALVWKALNEAPLGDDEWERASMNQAFDGPTGAAVAVISSVIIGVESVLWCT